MIALILFTLIVRLTFTLSSSFINNPIIISMELNESDHKKLVAQLRQSTASLIDQYPFSRTGLRPYRNLLYLIQKEQKLEGEELLN